MTSDSVKRGEGTTTDSNANNGAHLRQLSEHLFLLEDTCNVYLVKDGGIISALIDIAGDFAIASKLGLWVPTIDLRVDYLRPAREGALVALARAVKVGKTVGVADVELRNGQGAVVAVGRAAYSTSS